MQKYDFTGDVFLGLVLSPSISKTRGDLCLALRRQPRLLNRLYLPWKLMMERPLSSSTTLTICGDEVDFKRYLDDGRDYVLNTPNIGMYHASGAAQKPNN